MLINLPQPGHPDPAAKLVQDAHAGHLRLTAQSGKLPPRPLLRQHFDQQVQGMHRRKQTQQMHPIKLCRAVIPPLAAGRTGRPAGVDEIVWNKRIHQFKQGDRAGRRKVGIHARQPIAGNPTRQQQCPTPLISVALHCLTTDCKNFRNTLYHDRFPGIPKIDAPLRNVATTDDCSSPMLLADLIISSKNCNL